MTKFNSKILSSFLIVAALGAVVYGINLKKKSSLRQPTLAAATAPVSPYITKIDLLSDRAKPDVVAIKINQSVQFDTKDGQKHQISSGKGADGLGDPHQHDSTGIESAVFGPEEAYLLKFSKAGTYYFHDHFNPKIAATVIVYDSSKH
ncbi:MAG: hypothetical protein NVSMB66_3890 [Candidatus Doudnabacteria bacterium]